MGRTISGEFYSLRTKLLGIYWLWASASQNYMHAWLQVQKQRHELCAPCGTEGHSCSPMTPSAMFSHSLLVLNPEVESSASTFFGSAYHCQPSCPFSEGFLRMPNIIHRGLFHLYFFVSIGFTSTYGVSFNPELWHEGCKEECAPSNNGEFSTRFPTTDIP